MIRNGKLAHFSENIFILSNKTDFFPTIVFDYSKEPISCKCVWCWRLEVIPNDNISSSTLLSRASLQLLWFLMAMSTSKTPYKFHCLF